MGTLLSPSEHLYSQEYRTGAEQWGGLLLRKFLLIKLNILHIRSITEQAQDKWAALLAEGTKL